MKVGDKLTSFRNVPLFITSVWLQSNPPPTHPYRLTVMCLLMSCQIVLSITEVTTLGAGIVNLLMFSIFMSSEVIHSISCE